MPLPFRILTDPMPTSHVLPTYARFPVNLVRGRGTRVWDDRGREYLDFCSGIAVNQLGHSPPCVVEAISRQAAEMIHCSNLYGIPLQEELARVIVEDHVKLPGKVFFANSGAEANDGLIKTARRFGHARPRTDGGPRYEILSFRNSFHGRTLGGISATGQDKVKAGFDPLPGGFRHLPFNDPGALREAVGAETAAILLEPVQGEGGVNVATPEFLREVRAVCREYDLLLMLDEVQAGFGRCGQSMAWREILPDLEPDAISWAKGMGGGFPIGAFWLADRAIDGGGTALSSLMGPGSHGTTYGGGPLACAASLAVLGELARPEIAANVRERAAQIHAAVAAWKHPLVSGSRGLGLLIGVGLETSCMDVPEGAMAAGHLSARLLEAGLLAPPAGPETLRLLPPLNVSAEEVGRALEMLRGVLDSLLLSKDSEKS